MEPLDLSQSIAIIGLGVRSAVGLTASAAAAAVRAGIARLSEHPYLIDKIGEPMRVAMEPTLDPAEQSTERFARLARPALQEALTPLVQHMSCFSEIHTLIGLPDPRPGLPLGIEHRLEQLHTELGLADRTGQNITLLPNGHAAGMLAMQRARDLLQAGRARFCLAGGVDSYLIAESLEWMDEQGILKSEANRNGFPPGEGAGFCLLATEATARQFGLPVLGRLEAIASAREENRIRTKTICIGRGLSDAIIRTTSRLRLPEERIDETICDLNGEPYRSEEFAFTVLRTQLAFVNFSRFATPSDCWGDVGAASGPLFASLAIAAGRRGYARGPRIMLWASSEGGDRAAAIIHVAGLTGRNSL